MAIQENKPKYRRPLNIEQVEILELLYKFRFVTIETLKNYFAESNPGMNVFRRLEVLEQQNFIAKRYFDNYRLMHKPVAYYLLPAGARKLGDYRDEDDTDEINIKTIYRDGTVREQFAMHCVTLFDIYNRLTNLYDDALDFFTKSDQAEFDNFPMPVPDAYITIQEEPERHYFIDVLDDDAHFLVDASKKIRRFIDYRNCGNWSLISDSKFPDIVFICNSEEACIRVRKRCEAILNKAWMLDADITVATSDRLKLS